MDTPQEYSPLIEQYADASLPLGWLAPARSIGRQLKALHATTVPFQAQPERPLLLPVPATFLQEMTDGMRWTLQEIPFEVNRVYRSVEIRLSREPQVFVHGDLSLDNVLATPAKTVFIDWELAGMGSAIEDLSSLAASFIGIRLRTHIQAEDRRTSLSAFSKELADFLRAVSGSASMPSSGYKNQLLLRATSLKLLARAQVAAAASVPHHGYSSLLLRFSVNMLAHSDPWEDGAEDHA